MRTAIGATNNPDLALFYEQRLRDAGIPATAQLPGGYPGAEGPSLLIIENDQLLNDPDVRAVIESILQEDADLPDPARGHVVEPETPPTWSWPAGWFVLLWVAGALAFVVLLLLGVVLWHTFT
jgi:hypothetical protein